MNINILDLNSSDCIEIMSLNSESNWFSVDPVIDLFSDSLRKDPDNEIKFLYENGFRADITVNNEKKGSKYWIEFFHGDNGRISFYELVDYYKFLNSAIMRGYYPIPIFTVPTKGTAEEVFEKVDLPFIDIRDYICEKDLFAEVNSEMEKSNDVDPAVAKEKFRNNLELFKKTYSKYFLPKSKEDGFVI